MNLDRSRVRPLALVRRIASLGGWTIVIAGASLLLIPGLVGLDRYVITGSSMAPELERGSVVLADAVPVERLQVGDVITYQPPADTGVTQLVTHRIVAIGEAEDGSRMFTTQGDANDLADPWTFSLPAENQNVVRYSLPWVGWALIGFAHPLARLVIIGVPVALVAGWALIERVGELRRRAARGAPTRTGIEPVRPGEALS